MKKVVTFGEIMLRLAPQGFLRFSQASSFDVIYGGGESNVAVSLANYGVDVDFVTRLPKNDIGESAMMEMRKRGVGVDKIIWGGNRLGIYFLEILTMLIFLNLVNINLIITEYLDIQTCLFQIILQVVSKGVIVINQKCFDHSIVFSSISKTFSFVSKLSSDISPNLSMKSTDPSQNSSIGSFK